MQDEIEEELAKVRKSAEAARAEAVEQKRARDRMRAQLAAQRDQIEAHLDELGDAVEPLGSLIRDSHLTNRRIDVLEDSMASLQSQIVELNLKLANLIGAIARR